MKKWLPSLILAGGLAALSFHIPKDLNTSGVDLEPSERAQVNQGALGRVLGEFRTGTSDLLFVKTERYLHAGVGFVTHQEERNEQGMVADGSGAVGTVETIIPSEDRDFRGWIGKMQREVKPWESGDGHGAHSGGNELIPWFRIMTLSDPHYIQGYLAGAFWLSTKDPEEAYAFLEEGVEKNPEAFQLRYTKAMFQIRKIRELDPNGALSTALPEQKVLLAEARENLTQALELMLDEIPKGMNYDDLRHVNVWGRYKAQDAMLTAYLAVILERQYGPAGAADALQQRILQVLPDHPQLSR